MGPPTTPILESAFSMMLEIPFASHVRFLVSRIPWLTFLLHQKHTSDEKKTNSEDQQSKHPSQDIKSENKVSESKKKEIEVRAEIEVENKYLSDIYGT